MFRRNGASPELQAAIALLIQNQARFVSHLDEDRQRFSRIERKLDEITFEISQMKALLLKHEEMLRRLPDAIKDKIGFKQ